MSAPNKMDNAQQHANLLKLIDELEDYAFIFLDTEGNIQTWNRGAQKIKGYTNTEIIGRNFRLFYTEEDRSNKKPDHLLTTAMTTGKAQDEGWRVRKDGTTFWGNITITAVHNAQGGVVGFGKLTRDLTDRKLAEQALVLDIKNKELEQFNYIASHDLQEPLRTISNYLQIIDEDYSNELNDEVKKYLHIVGRSTSRMSILVRTLLDFSRLGKSRKIDLVNCNLLLENVMNDLNNLIETTGVKITIDQLPVIPAYETELGQLFQNLISNAIKFRRKDIPAEIWIGCRSTKIIHEFFVADNGIGIEPKYFERIFQIFQKLNSDREFEGYGIGLANCKKIAEMHGGKIWIESEKGKGSTFKFTVESLKYE